MKTLETILTGISGLREVRGERTREVRAIRYDSRRVAPGDMYVAVNGRDDRGLEYLPAAVEAGAKIVVVDDIGRVPADLLASDLTLVLVEDARRAMAAMAHRLFDFPGSSLKVYGVTGTNGKTTVTYVLRQLLEACGECAGVIGTLGKVVGRIVPTGYTTPEAPELAEILDEMRKARLTAVAMEVSSHALALDRVTGLNFDGVIFTNLTQDHLDFHSSFQEYHDAKKLLFDRLDAGRPAVVNIDDLHGASMVRDCNADVYRYGSSAKADAKIEEVYLAPENSRWELRFSNRLGGGQVSLSAPLVGAFNVSNITGALVLAMAAGYDRETLLNAVAALRPVPGRMESIPLGNGATAVIDYAHTPDALENVLRTLRETGGAGVTVVFGCGGNRDAGKRPIMGAIAARLADRVILTSDNPRGEDPGSIMEDIAAGISSGVSVKRIADRALAIEHALDESAAGDLVLIAGKGHEDYQIIGAERRHFSDGEQVRAWIAARRTEGMAAA